MTIEQRIREDIELRIRSGEWKPGHRIPFEHELVAQYGCARATVSKALSGLAKAGLIERRRKAGSFVALPHLEAPVLEIPELGAAIAARGETYGYRLLSRKLRKIRQSDPAEERLATSGQVLELEGVHRAAGQPFCREQRLILVDTVPEVLDEDFAEQSPGTWLLANVPWSQARHRISAVGADRHDARILELPSGTPCLRIERWTWRMSKGVTYVVQTFPGDRYDLVAEFSPRAE